MPEGVVVNYFVCPREGCTSSASGMMTAAWCNKHLKVVAMVREERA